MSSIFASSNQCCCLNISEINTCRFDRVHEFLLITRGIPTLGLVIRNVEYHELSVVTRGLNPIYL